jgi:hypothetical protein
VTGLQAWTAVCCPLPPFHFLFFFCSRLLRNSMNAATQSLIKGTQAGSVDPTAGCVVQQHRAMPCSNTRCGLGTQVHDFLPPLCSGDEEDVPAAAAPPAKKRVNSLKGPKAALAAAAAALAKRAASALGAGTGKQPKPAAAAAAEEKGAGRQGAGVQAASPSKGKAGGRKANKEAEAVRD